MTNSEGVEKSVETPGAKSIPPRQVNPSALPSYIPIPAPSRVTRGTVAHFIPVVTQRVPSKAVFYTTKTEVSEASNELDSEEELILLEEEAENGLSDDELKQLEEVDAEISSIDARMGEKLAILDQMEKQSRDELAELARAVSES